MEIFVQFSILENYCNPRNGMNAAFDGGWIHDPIVLGEDRLKSDHSVTCII